jgi:hypothetical protein
MYKYGLHAIDGLLMVNVRCTSSKIWTFLKFIYDVDLCVSNGVIFVLGCDLCFSVGGAWWLALEIGCPNWWGCVKICGWHLNGLNTY